MGTKAYNTGPTSEVTTLPNKIRVTTETTPGHFQALGVYIDAGSRFESPATSGVSHLLDRMAFKVSLACTIERPNPAEAVGLQTTKDFSSAEMSNIIDSLGSNIHCSSSRETIMYQSTIFSHDLPKALSVISSSILRPILSPEELEAQKDAAAYEIREIWAKPEMILPEVLHTVAFKDNTLGMPLLCPEERLDEISVDTLKGYMRDWYRPERMVVAGVGMPHAELVDLTKEMFGNMETTYGTSTGSTTSSSKIFHPSKTPPPSLSKSFATLHENRFDGSSMANGQGYQELASAKARYTGGEMFIDKPDEEFLHVYVAFEGLGIHDPDIVSVATIVEIPQSGTLIPRAAVLVRLGDNADASRWRGQLLSRRTRKGNVFPTVHKRLEPALPSRLLRRIPPLLCRLR